MNDLKQLFTTSRLQRPEDGIGFWVWRLSLAYQRRAESALKEIDLTHLQFVILVLSAWLNYTSEKVNQRDLVEISGVQEAQVSLMVKALKAKKLISQNPSTEDTRVRLIVVTAEGIRLLAKAIPLMSSLQAELWPPGAQTDQLMQLVENTLQRWETKYDE